MKVVGVQLGSFAAHLSKLQWRTLHLSGSGSGWMQPSRDCRCLHQGCASACFAATLQRACATVPANECVWKPMLIRSTMFGFRHAMLLCPASACVTYGELYAQSPHLPPGMPTVSLLQSSASPRPITIPLSGQGLMSLQHQVPPAQRTPSQHPTPMSQQYLIPAMMSLGQSSSTHSPALGLSQNPLMMINQSPFAAQNGADGGAGVKSRSQHLGMPGSEQTQHPADHGITRPQIVTSPGVRIAHSLPQRSPQHE